MLKKCIVTRSHSWSVLSRATFTSASGAGPGSAAGATGDRRQGKKAKASGNGLLVATGLCLSGGAAAWYLAVPGSSVATPGASKTLSTQASSHSMVGVGGSGLTQTEAESLLRRGQSTRLLETTIPSSSVATTNVSAGIRPPAADSFVVRLDLASVASNDPKEDFCVIHKLANNATLLAVIDGHGGTECARVVAEHIGAYVAHALDVALANPTKKPSFPLFSNTRLWASPLSSTATTNPPSPNSPVSTAAADDDSDSPDPVRKQAIMTALVSAFTRLDEDICNGGIDVPLATDDTTTSDLIRAHLRPALAGACTLLAYVEGRDIYVACTGDSRAVVGRRSIDGVWSALDLSVDQTVKNPQEYSRLLDEHPGELETVVVKGRVLGGLMPTRAFGDARYKWPTSLSSILLPHITNRNPPRNYFTPPYVTAKPVVTHYRATPSRDLFLVLATDGLYDELSSDDVVTVLSGFLQHSHVAAAPGVAWGADALSGDAARGFAMTKDANAATCLIRNALGGANEEKMRKLLGIPAPYCRRFRDDITVQVLFFGQDIEQQEKVGLDVARLVSEAEDVVEGELPPVDLRLAGVKQHRLQAWTSYLARLERMERKEKEGAVKSKL